MKDIIQVEIMNSGLDTSDYLAIITVFLAWLSLLISIIYNNKNYRLLSKQYELKLPNINFKVKRCYKKRISDEFFTYNYFIEIQNMSESPNSINDIELRISYRIENEKLNFNLKPIETYTDIKTLENPINTSGKETKTGWLVFRAPVASFADKSIDSYELRLCDIHNKLMTDKTILMNEESNI